MVRQSRVFVSVVLGTCLLALVVGWHPWSKSSLIGTEAKAIATADAPGLVAQSPTPELSQSPSFTDPGQRYSIALLDGFKAHQVAGQSVLESADGNVAYSVSVAPTLSNPSTLLTNAALAQMAQVTFQQGEGFIATRFQSLDQGGIKIDWTGQVTTRASQPLSGTIFAQQFEDQVFLLLIAATEEGQDEFAEAIATLPSSLRPLAL